MSYRALISLSKSWNDSLAKIFFLLITFTCLTLTFFPFSFTTHTLLYSVQEMLYLHLGLFRRSNSCQTLLKLSKLL